MESQKQFILLCKMEFDQLAVSGISRRIVIYIKGLKSAIPLILASR